MKGDLIKTVFFNYAPVARFNTNERKVAAIELVERGLCNQNRLEKSMIFTAIPF